MIESVLMVLAALALLWIAVARYLRGPSLVAFDHPGAEGTVQRFPGADASNPEHQAVLDTLRGMSKTIATAPGSRRIAAIRAGMDQLFSGREFAARFVPVDAGGVRSEWVLAPGADSARRTLYIHGGAYIAGSPRSHRVITTRFSEMTGGAVLAIDYRLMPEHPRLAGIEDCRNAYRWLLDNGPGGPGAAKAMFVAGDSAGGNLTLSLIAWVRDQGLRPPDAAVALSPATDSTAGSPSLRANIETDAMLGPLYRRLAAVPRSVLLWVGWIQNRMRPCHPAISPVFGDLSRLPPVLVQASEWEMLIDDSRRYVNKAAAAGSPVRLQTWAHEVHVWQIFDPGLSEAREAFEEIRKFLAAAAPPGATTTA